MCLSVGLQNDMQPLKASCPLSAVLHGDLGELVKGQPPGWLSQITLVWQEKGQPAAISSPAWLNLNVKAAKELYLLNLSTYGAEFHGCETRRAWPCIMYVRFYVVKDRSRVALGLSRGSPHTLLSLRFSGE